MTISPNLDNLPYKYNNGVKYFELIAEPVEQEILQGLFIKGWGYNGSIPGPTILVEYGDYVNIRVINHLPEATSVHWHGLDIPNRMDGVPDVEPSPKIEPGAYFDYHFRITNPAGTHMYHTHVNSAKQQMMGLGGAFIINDAHDKECLDFSYILQEFKLKDIKNGEIKPGIYEIDPYSMGFNFFTMNGRCYPYVDPIYVNLGDQIKIRLGNVSHDSHPMHLHGQQFIVSASDGNPIRPENRLIKNTINVASGETFDIEFNANNPGIWPFHCHIPHHMCNNLTEPFGGMATTINTNMK